MKARKYLVVDTETCTLPEYANDKKLAITHPLIYDIGWVLTDYKGTIYSKKSFLVQEIFFNEELFSTAYYRDKKPLYFQKLSKCEIRVETWAKIWAIFQSDLEQANFICAYNANFDLKKSIPFTFKCFEKNSQFFSATPAEKNSLFLNTKNSLFPEAKTRSFSEQFFTEKNEPFFLGKPAIDLWFYSCDTFLGTVSYKKYASENNWYSPSKKYYNSSAEKAYSYIVKNASFSEAHLALEDALIESLILRHCLKRKKPPVSIEWFPFRKLRVSL